MARQRILPDWISIDPSSHELLYRQISQQIERAVDEDRLATGTYLPGSRVLATHLGVSRLTVLSAYELLVADGLLETIIGSGTRVSDTLGERGPKSPETTLPEGIPTRPHEPLPPSLVQPKLGSIAFKPGTPALDRFPRQVWSRMLRRHGLCGERDVLGSGHRGGYAPLRDMIARYLAGSRGLRCSPSQVIVVGSTRAAIFVACSVLAEWGDSVVWGDPGYRMFRTTIELSGLKLAPVPVDDNGLCVSDLAARAPAARLAYVTPCHHWPTGVTLSSDRRRDLVAWTKRQDGWVLEDDYDSEFRFDGPPVRPLKAEFDSEQVIFLGSFAKTLAPAIRCAYLVVPASLEQPFIEHATGIGVEPALHIQAALADFIKEGYYTRHVQNMRKVYHTRRDMLDQALRETLGDRVTVRRPEGGLQLIVDLPPDISAEAVSERATDHDLSIRPLSLYYLTIPPPNALHLGFAPVPEADIAPAVRRLAEVINTFA
jgi:GntR family transcriptional regulator/MocR family aminotransferase